MTNYNEFFPTLTDTNSDNPLITVEELAEILLIGKNSAYDLLRSGEIKAFRIGNKWKIPKESISLYIAEQTHNPFNKPFK